VQYARDKRRQLAIVEQLAERWRRVEGRNRIGAYAMHPGWTETEGVKRSLPGFYDSMKDKLRTLEQGADTAVWLACEDESKLQSGALYLDRRVQTKHLPLSFTKYSQAAAQRLIQRLDEMGKLTLASS
jgi:dehydrogenase/reductase SDR family member 12